MNRLRLAVLATAVVLATMGALPEGAAAAKTILIKGSTTMQSTIDAVGNAYERATKRRVRVVVSGGTSDFGLSQVARGKATIANVSRDPISADGRLNVAGGKKLAFNKVARDAVCVVTSPENPISSLSRSQIRQIFSGQIASWSQVPGAKASGPITLYVRPRTSGTHDAFQTIFMGLNKPIDDRATEVGSAGQQASQIANDPSGIGYVSFKFTRDLHNVPYNGVRCSQSTARSGQYGGVRNLWMVTRGTPRGTVKAFIRFVRNDRRAKRIINKVFLPK